MVWSTLQILKMSKRSIIIIIYSLSIIFQLLTLPVESATSTHFISVFVIIERWNHYIIKILLWSLPACTPEKQRCLAIIITGELNKGGVGVVGSYVRTRDGKFPQLYIFIFTTGRVTFQKALTASLRQSFRNEFQEQFNIWVTLKSENKLL